MNRVGLGLAVGAGYVLGRTKKMKLALAVGSAVAGRRMHLSPRALGDVVSQQLLKNPQFKEIGDQLREDLRGVGKAATGTLLERRLEGLADRLHGRTALMRDQLAGVTPEVPGRDEAEEPEEAGEEVEEPRERDERETDHEYDEAAGEEPEEEPEAEPEPPRREAPAKKTAEKKAPAKKAAAKKTPGKKPAAKKEVGRMTGAKKASVRKPAPREATRTRVAKGGGGDD